MIAPVLAEMLHERAVVGTFMKLPKAEVVDVLALAGFDFAVLDLEHSQATPVEVRETLLAARANRLPMVVRVATLDSGETNRLLEAGAAGVQLSDVTSAEQASLLRASLNYAPLGSRSISLAQPAARYGAVPLRKYLADAQGKSLAIGQLESVDYADGFDAIMSNLDVAFIGPTDLSVAAGTPGNITTGFAATTIDRIELAAARVGTPLGGWAPTAEAAAAMMERGYRYLVVGSDLSMLAASSRQALRATREQEPQAGDRA